MPRQDLCDITIVLDRSGSMDTIKSDTIGGYNTFIDEQKKQPGDANLTLVQFDTIYEFVHQAIPIKQVPAMTEETFRPRGGTALLDAIGRAIVETGERLSATAEEQRPGKVVFVIITDGQENSSKEYDRPKVFDMIKHQTDAYQWEFIYLGANQDAIKVAQSMGVKTSGAMSTAATPDGVKFMWEDGAKHVAAYRSGTPVAFTDEDRERQKEAMKKS